MSPCMDSPMTMTVAGIWDPAAPRAMVGHTQYIAAWYISRTVTPVTDITVFAAHFNNILNVTCNGPIFALRCCIIGSALTLIPIALRVAEKRLIVLKQILKRSTSPRFYSRPGAQAYQ
jgi:hypothetical protein